MFGKIKSFIDFIKKQAAAVGPKITALINNNRLADGIMRWPRIVAFFLVTVMFIVGWFNTAGLLAFATAISALPSDFWSLVFIVVGSIGASKLSNDIVKVISSRK